MLSWIIIIVVVAALAGGYAWMFYYARKRQKSFDAQYTSMKERHDVFVLNKRIVKERPKSGWMKYARFKTYQVVGRVSVSQAVRGMQMSRMQTMTFHTTKQEFDKIQPNHKYKMDIAGNYIGFVIAPPPTKDTKAKESKKTDKKGSAGSKGAKTTGQTSQKEKKR